jgi:hypothetical protein
MQFVIEKGEKHRTEFFYPLHILKQGILTSYQGSILIAERYT